MFYSADTGGFYSPEVHGVNMPEDVVEIADEYYQELLIGNSSGKLIKSDDEGYPILVDPPPFTSEQILATQSQKLQELVRLAAAQKDALVNRISDLESAIENIGIEGQEEFAATPEEEAEYPVRKAQLTKWKNYSISLGRVTAQEGWFMTVSWPAQPIDGMDLTVSAVSGNGQ